MKTMIVHEWRRLVRAPSFWLLLGVTSLFLAYGTANGLSWVKSRETAITYARDEQQRARDAAKAALNATGDDQQTKHLRERAAEPFNVGQDGTLVVLPLRPAASLSVGQADVFQSTSTVSTYGKTRRRSDRYEVESPLSLEGGRFDLTFVLVYVLPLIVLALTYGLLGEEREDGTLALLLAHPIGLVSVLTAKLTTRAGALAAAAITVPLVVLTAYGALPRVQDIAMFVAVVVGYIAFWALLAAAVNVWVKQAASTAATLAAFWVAFVLVLPTLGSVLVTRLAPLPSRFELLDAMRTDDLKNLDGRKLLDKWYGDHPELAREVSTESWTERYTLVQRETMRRTRDLENAFAERQRAQYHLGNQLRFVSPAAIVREALDVIAGNDTGRFIDFRERADAFNPTWADWFTPRITGAQKLTASDYDALPQFAEADTNVAAGAVGVALLALGAYLVACVGAIVVRFRQAPDAASLVVHA